MSSRVDISPYLVHFTKGHDINHAFDNLLSIISRKVIYGTNTLIKGGYDCVCFSETPIETLPNGLINSQNYSKYSPFGILISKEWLFSAGGRPVIYQTEEEFDHLSEYNKWRHMTYNPIVDPPIDFTWEREWRIKAKELLISPSFCSIIVPNRSWADALISIHDSEQDWQVQQYEFIYDDRMLAEMYCEDFRWNIFLLDD